MIVTTDKTRITTYVKDEVKEELTRLAKARRRSVSNVIELLIEDAIAEAKKKGEIK